MFNIKYSTMKKLSVVLMVCMIVLFISCENSKSTNMETANNNDETVIFPKGNKGPADWFTGTTWVTPLIQKGGDITYSIGNVVFEAGARTNWHTHPAGQILLVTDGHGFYQEKGKAAQALKKGDAVNIPAHVEHWHGAAPDSRLVHIAITNYKEETNVDWLKPVTDEEYNSVVKK
jgi:quercetin dioxygenase-like cupin family protein